MILSCFHSTNNHSIKGTEIQIKMFDDRLVFESLGKLPGMVKPDNIRYAHFSRNPKIASESNKIATTRCRNVQWSFRGISTPMGMATYNNIRIKDLLPTQEQLAERVRLLPHGSKGATTVQNHRHQLWDYQQGKK